MKTKCLVVISFFLGFSFLASPVFAVTLRIDQAPATITDQPFTIDVSLTGAQSGQNYLRVDLYKDGTSNYFGETSVGSNWYSGSDGTQYVPITVTDSKTIITATLQSRLGSPSSTDYPGVGAYKLRIRRYTGTGNSATTDESPIDVQIVYAFPTATPTPSPIPTPTDLPTPTRTPTPTKVPTPTKTLTASVITPIKSVTPSNSIVRSANEGAMPSNYPTSVLGISDSKITPTATLSKQPILVKGSSDNSNNVLTLIFCGIGGGMLIICAILFYLNKRRGEFNSSS